MGVELLPHAVGESIGGIDEDEVEAVPASAACEPASQRPTSARTSSARSRRPSALDVAERRPGVAVDQDRVRGAARERLDRQRAGAAVEVEDAGARRPSPSAEKIASRTRSEVGRTFQPRGATRRCPFSSPAITLIAIERNRVGGAGAEAAAGGLEQRPERRVVERAVAAQQRRAPPRGPRAGRRVLGQLGDGEARQAVLAGAEDLALAAQAEVDLGQLEAVALARRPPPAAAAPARPPLRRRAGSGTACSPRPTRPRSWCSWETPKRSAPSITITVALATSIPTSITVVATSTSVSPAAKARHRLGLRRPRASGRGGRRPRSRAARPPRSRSASTSAALPCSFSDSATSGQTTKAWRPSRSRSRRNS